MRFFRNIFITISIVAGFLLMHSSAFADTASATSANWSGYIAQSGTYTGVSGTFVMPKISYSSTLASNATWVGIGGKPGSTDLIQAGVYEIANSDGAIYQAWYELLPGDSVPIDLAVHPGDSISVAILETTQDTWNIVITNNTTNQQFEKTVNYQSSLSSAEWIQERPLVDGTFSTLSGFTPVTFTGTTAIQNGTRIPLTQTNPQMVNLVTSNNVALSVPSPLTVAGTSFSVYRTSASDSTLATGTATAPVPSPAESVTPPFELHRTGRTVVVPVPDPIPNITWVVHF